MTTCPKTITIDNTEYVRADSIPKADAAVRLVVLQRGWCVVGRYTQEGEHVTISDASVIRVWGTTSGLGQLVNGPTANTKLDKSGTIEAHALAVVLTIAADEKAWEKHL